MGHNKSKHVFNFEEYGLTPSEAEMLENCFNHAAGKHHGLNHHDFKELYISMYPEADIQHANDMANHAFRVADTNHDGKITFDEFAAFYLTHRTQPHHGNNVISEFLNQNSGKSGCITKNQAQQYISLAHNFFGNPSSVPSVEEIVTVFESYGDQIPIDIFLREVTPFYKSERD